MYQISKILLVLIISLLSSMQALQIVSAQEQNSITSLRGKVLQIEENTEEEVIVNNFRIELDDGSVITIDQPFRPELQDLEFRVGDRVIIDKSTFGESVNYVITDVERLPTLYLLLGLFAFLVVLVGKRKGFYSLISLGISYYLIIKVMLNQILIGRNALFTAIWVAAILIPFNYFLSHGISRKTAYAAVSTLITMIITGVFSIWVVSISRLTGYTSDEAGFLLQITGGAISTKELLLAGIIIGTLGILDDITISQTSIANELKASKSSISFSELFVRTMRIGRDHIASLVNTLILVYTSASLPLLILIERSEAPFLTTLNREVVMEELIIMLLTSIALIIAVPISTYIACFFIERFGPEELDDGHIGHSH